MPILLYGANGYTGELVARRAAARGLAQSRLILAGRRAEALAPLTAQLSLEARVFAAAASELSSMTGASASR